LRERERERENTEKEKKRYKERGNCTRRDRVLRGGEERRKATLATLQTATLHTT